MYQVNNYYGNVTIVINNETKVESNKENIKGTNEVLMHLKPHINRIIDNSTEDKKLENFINGLI
jgi:hypothetical protein